MITISQLFVKKMETNNQKVFVSPQEEKELLEDNSNSYQGQNLSFKRASRRGEDDLDQDMTESEIVIKNMQEVEKTSFI